MGIEAIELDQETIEVVHRVAEMTRMLLLISTIYTFELNFFVTFASGLFSVLGGWTL